MAQNKEPSFNITVKDYLNAHLGLSTDDRGNLVLGEHVKSSFPVPYHIAASIFEVCENKEVAFITWPEATSLMKFPILWDIRDYRASYERDQKLKEESHKRRVESFIREENVKILSKRIMEDSFVSYEAAVSIALKGLKDPKRLKALVVFYDIEFLLSREEDLKNI